MGERDELCACGAGIYRGPWYSLMPFLFLFLFSFITIYNIILKLYIINKESARVNQILYLTGTGISWRINKFISLMILICVYFDDT